MTVLAEPSRSCRRFPRGVAVLRGGEDEGGKGTEKERQTAVSRFGFFGTARTARGPGGVVVALTILLCSLARIGPKGGAAILVTWQHTRCRRSGGTDEVPSLSILRPS